jgi:hypothetical protein
MDLLKEFLGSACKHGDYTTAQNVAFFRMSSADIT